MRRTDPSGRQCHWILEVHLVDREREIGGFFEQLLTVRRPGALRPGRHRVAGLVHAQRAAAGQPQRDQPPQPWSLISPSTSTPLVVRSA